LLSSSTPPGVCSAPKHARTQGCRTPAIISDTATGSHLGPRACPHADGHACFGPSAERRRRFRDPESGPKPSITALRPCGALRAPARAARRCRNRPAAAAFERASASAASTGSAASKCASKRPGFAGFSEGAWGATAGETGALSPRKPGEACSSDVFNSLRSHPRFWPCAPQSAPRGDREYWGARRSQRPGRPRRRRARTWPSWRRAVTE
jgi:hypothetical protein